MKKFFAIAFVAASLVACGEKKPATNDSPADTTSAKVDSPAVKVDSPATETKPAAEPKAEQK
ncbi:MAG: hypothetical protein ACKO6Q_01090 [Bacteroidota bacterium]